MASTATTPSEYLAELPPDRAEAVGAVRDVVLAHLPDGYEEVMSYGMISYVIPLDRYPDTYNGQPLQYAAIASQKQHMAVYLSGVYADPQRTEAFRQSYLDTGKKLDMGKSCVRFRTLDQLPLEVIGEQIASCSVDEYIALYELNRR